MEVTDCIYYVVSIIINIALIFLSAIHVVEFDEIKTSKKNPIEQCKFLNALVLPEYLLQAAVTLIFLLLTDLLSLAFSIPLLVYHLYRYWTRPVMSQPGLYDPTTILSQDHIERCKREGWINLACYILAFFTSIYGFVSSANTVNVKTIP